MRHLQFLFVLVFVLGCVAGCYHPQALYEEAPRPPLEKGREEEKKHKYAEAEQEYEQIDDITVKNMALNQLSSAWENVNADITHFQKMVAGAPGSADFHLRLGQEYYQKGLLCTRYSQESLGVYPRDFVRGEQEYYYSAALEEAQKALQLHSDIPEASLLIGEIYLANQMRNKALAELKQMIARHPDFARGYYAVGKVYFDMGNYEMSERYFIRAIKLDPTLYDAYYLLGQFFLEQGWFDYAAHTYLEILRHKPEDGPALEMLVDSCHELGNYYTEQEQFDEAIRLFQEVLKVKSSYAIHQSFLVAQEKKKEAELLKEQQAAIEEIAPQETPEIAEIKAQLFADQTLVNLLPTIDSQGDGEFETALQRFETKAFQEGYDLLLVSPEKNRTNPYRSLALAYALQQLGREDEAKQALRQLTTTATVTSQIQLLAWLALRSMGEELDPSVIYRVLGVILEVQLPEHDAVEVLATYLDGRVWYISHTGNILLWDLTEGEISDRARNVIYTAQAIARDFPSEQARPPVNTDSIRISLLTCGGIRVLEDNATRVKQQTSLMSPIYKVGTELLERLLEIYNR
jgi:tetratricopeptide (TPR) repeat protein